MVKEQSKNVSLSSLPSVQAFSTSGITKSQINYEKSVINDREKKVVADFLNLLTDFDKNLQNFDHNLSVTMEPLLDHVKY